MPGMDLAFQDVKRIYRRVAAAREVLEQAERTFERMLTSEGGVGSAAITHCAELEATLTDLAWEVTSISVEAGELGKRLRKLCQ